MFHEQLPHRGIYAPGSTKWTDPQVRLLTGPAWERASGPALRALQLPEDPEDLLTDISAELDTAWRQLAAGLDSGASARLDEQGRPHVEALDAVPDPPSLLALRDRLDAVLPAVDLPELILEVISWEPRLIEAFRSVSGAGTRVADLDVTVTAALCAHALNLGYGPVINESIPA